MTKRDRQGLMARIAKRCIIGNRFPGIRRQLAVINEEGSASTVVAIKSAEEKKKKKYIFHAVPRNIYDTAGGFTTEAVSHADSFCSNLSLSSSSQGNFDFLQPMRPKASYWDLKSYYKYFTNKPDRRRHDRLKDRRVGSMQTIRQVSPEFLGCDEDMEYAM